MNIIFLEGDMSRSGGTERMTAILANELCHRNTVYILTLRGGKSFFPLSDSVRHILLPGNGVRRAIRNHLKSLDADILINVDTGMAIFGIPAAAGLRTHIITWEHSNFLNNWDSRFFPHIRRFAARYSSAIVVLTERDKVNYLSGISRCRPICVIGNPVTPHAVRYDRSSKIILSAGHLSDVKRFSMIPEIGKAVFSRHPDWCWHICGDGPDRELIEAKISKYGLENNIILTGRLTDMEPEYRAAAMYVMTSRMEGLPMVLLEAKSYGLPIVSFDIMTGPAEVVRDGVNGYLVKDGYADEMSERICALIESADLRQQFSNAAALDMDKFDKERIVGKWERLLVETEEQRRLCL